MSKEIREVSYEDMVIENLKRYHHVECSLCGSKIDKADFSETFDSLNFGVVSGSLFENKIVRALPNPKDESLLCFCILCFYHLSSKFQETKDIQYGG